MLVQQRGQNSKLKSKMEEKEKKKTEKKEEIKKGNGKKPVEAVKKEPEKTEKEKEEKPAETKKEEIKPKREKTEASVNVDNLPLSTKQSIAICKFIKKKKIPDAIRDLEEVIALKKPVTMKGEIPHRRGKGMMSGRFPKRAAQRFIILLKSLLANANMNELEEPIIVEAIANIGSRPYGRFGSIRRKRTHLQIKAKEQKRENKKEREEKE